MVAVVKNDQLERKGRCTYYLLLSQFIVSIYGKSQSHTHTLYLYYIYMVSTPIVGAYPNHAESDKCPEKEKSILIGQPSSNRVII